MDREGKAGAVGPPLSDPASPLVPCTQQYTRIVKLKGDGGVAGSIRLRHPFHAAEEGNADYKRNKNLRAFQLLLGQSKL